MISNQPQFHQMNAIEAYERDGVVSLRRAFSKEWIESLADGMEIAISDSLKRDTAFNISNAG